MKQLGVIVFDETLDKKQRDHKIKEAEKQGYTVKDFGDFAELWADPKEFFRGK